MVPIENRGSRHHHLLAQLEAIDDDEPIEESTSGAVDPDFPERGLIPADWRLRRRIGHTVLDPTLEFVDIADGDTLQYLRTALAPLADKLNITDIDLSMVSYFPGRGEGGRTADPHDHARQLPARAQDQRR